MFLIDGTLGYKYTENIILRETIELDSLVLRSKGTYIIFANCDIFEFTENYNQSNLSFIDIFRISMYFEESDREKIKTLPGTISYASAMGTYTNFSCICETIEDNVTLKLLFTSFSQYIATVRSHFYFVKLK